MTTALDQIWSFLVSRRGEAYCDGCIQSEVGISRRRQVRDALFLLRFDKSHRFMRLRVRCSMCGTERLVCARR
jgi:hypothetical protein